MKYILGVVAVLALLFGAYSMMTAAPTAEQGVPDEIAELALRVLAEEEINNTPATPQGAESVINKENMTEQEQAISKAIVTTNQGDITIEFYTQDAPKTVANFVKLASEGFYNDVKFHRVIKGFMVQGGDPLSKVEGAAWGTGGPGYAFADEIHANNKNDKYTISMANSGPNTNGSQFFINTNDNNFLDSKHTAFGKVTSGMDIVDMIEGTATQPGDRPVEAQFIKSIVLE